MVKSSNKEIAKSVKTLLVMLQSLKDQQVTITLRNDTIVKGTILSVDSCMNIELQNAIVEIDNFYTTTTINEQAPDTSEVPTDDAMDCRLPMCDSELGSFIGTSKYADSPQELLTSINATANRQHEYFLVKGSRIRHIDIQTDNDLIAGTKKEIERIKNRGKQWNKHDIVRP